MISFEDKPAAMLNDYLVANPDIFDRDYTWKMAFFGLAGKIT